MRALLAALGERDITSVLVEGGGATIGALFDLNLVDKVVAFVAPVIIGGNEAISPVGGIGIAKMEEALRLRDVDVRRFGGDVAVIGYTWEYAREYAREYTDGDTGREGDVHRDS